MSLIFDIITYRFLEEMNKSKIENDNIGRKNMVIWYFSGVKNNCCLKINSLVMVKRITTKYKNIRYVFGIFVWYKVYTRFKVWKKVKKENEC